MIFKKRESALIAVDLDGVLTNTTNWWEGMPEPEPRLDIIQKIKDLYYKKHFIIIIYTSRKETARKETEAWLRKYGIPFYAIVMEKMGAECYIDDKAIRPDEIDSVLLKEK